MKFASDSGWRSELPKSNQFAYGLSSKSERTSFSDPIPESRPRAMLSVARSSGIPSRLLRRSLETNSSISLAVCPDMPLASPPTASCAVMCDPFGPVLNFSGLKKELKSVSEYGVPSAAVRSIM